MTNNITGLQFPKDAIQDLGAFNATPESTITNGSLNAFINQAMSSPMINILSSAQGSYIKNFDPGKFMTQKELSEQPWFNPTLKFPNGIGEDFAKLASKREDAKQDRQNIIDNMPSGFLSNTAKYSSSMLGFALSPVNAALSVGAPEIVGTRISGMLNALDEQVIAENILKKGIMGAGEGSAIMAPQAITNYTTGTQLGEDPTMLHPIAEMLTGAALGAAFHLLGGLIRAKKPMSAQSNSAAQEAAVAQMESGKKVNVAPIVKQGAYEQSLIDDGHFLENDKARDEIATKEYSDILTKHQDTLNDLALKTDSEDLEEREVANRAKSIKDNVGKTKAALDSEIEEGAEVSPIDSPNDIEEKIRPISAKFAADDVKPINPESPLGKLNKAIDDNNEVVAFIKSRQSVTAPVTADEIRDANNKMQSYESDVTYDKQRSLDFNREVNASPDDVVKDFNKSEEEFHAKENKTDEEQDLADELKQSDSDLDRRKSIIDAMTRCLAEHPNE